MTPTHNYAGPERRETTAMELLAAELKHMKETLEHPVYGLSALSVKMEALERRNSDGCKECTAWPRIAELEKQSERIKGIAVGIGAVWAVVSVVIGKLWK